MALPFATPAPAAPLKTAGNGAVAGGGDQMVGAIASQLLGIANDTGTHTVGHGASTISHAADRKAAKGRFHDYKHDATVAAKRAAKVVMGRNKGITNSYTAAANSIVNRANAQEKTANTEAIGRDKAYLSTQADLGLNAAAPAESRADTIADMLTGQSQANATAWKGFDQGAGRRAKERNTNTANSIKYQGRQQSVTLNGLLENVLAGLKDTSVASTLHSVSNTSTAQKMSALTGLRYLNSDEQDNTLAQQKLQAQLNGTTSTTAQYGSNGQLIGTSRTTRK